MSIEVEKTHYFTLSDGNNIMVSQLPQTIQDQVKIFDEIRFNLVQHSFETQVYQLAAEQKKAQLQKMLENYSEADKMAKSANKANATRETVASTEPTPDPTKAAKKTRTKKTGNES